MYGAFWKVCCELDVPMDTHTSIPAGYYDETLENMYEGLGGKYSVGPPFQFATSVSLHLLRMLVACVFDRFPKLPIIAGHLGGRLPIVFWRIYHWIEEVMKRYAAVLGDAICKADNIMYHLKHNIHLTTSGDFNTPALKFEVDDIAADRVLFSIDYPHETIERGCSWDDGEAEAIKDAVGNVS